MEIRAQHAKCKANFATLAEQRVRLVLSRFVPSLKLVQLTVENATISGLDVRVVVKVRLSQDSKNFSLESLDVDPMLAVDRLSESAALLIPRVLERMRPPVPTKILPNVRSRNIEQTKH